MLEVVVINDIPAAAPNIAGEATGESLPNTPKVHPKPAGQTGFTNPPERSPRPRERQRSAHAVIKSHQNAIVYDFRTGWQGGVGSGLARRGCLELETAGTPSSIGGTANSRRTGAADLPGHG